MNKAIFNLDNRGDFDLFRLHCIEQIGESQETWSNIDLLHSLNYKEYFSAYLDETGVLYNSADYQGVENMLVSAEQFDQAAEAFEKIMARCKDDYFQEN